MQYLWCSAATHNSASASERRAGGIGYLPTKVEPADPRFIKHKRTSPVVDMQPRMDRMAFYICYWCTEGAAGPAHSCEHKAPRHPHMDGPRTRAAPSLRTGGAPAGSPRAPPACTAPPGAAPLRLCPGPPPASRAPQQAPLAFLGAGESAARRPCPASARSGGAARCGATWHRGSGDVREAKPRKRTRAPMQQLQAPVFDAARRICSTRPCGSLESPAHRAAGP
jgi:hypothetical protein